MHAFLVVGDDSENLKIKTDALAEKLKATVLEFPLAKIEDSRALNSFVTLKVTQPTAIYIKGIEEATGEALNAFLKNLEEPQENLYYILTASSVKKVLPTIVSRCQIIKTINNSQLTINNEVEGFLKMTTGERLAFLDGIKDRERAIEFVDEFIDSCHHALHGKNSNYQELSKYLTSGISTLKALKANGNVVIQLTNMVIGMEK